MGRRVRALTLVVAAALIAPGCTIIGPDYEEPEPPVETDWLAYEDPRLDTGTPASPEWWKGAFADPVLDRLIEAALEENLSLRSAGLRVLQARQQLAIAIGNQYPQQQTVTGTAEKFRENDRTDEFYDLGFSVTWEADVWGRFRRQIESAEAQLDASLADYDGVLITLFADVAQTYLLIRTTEERLAVAKYNVELQRESVDITTAKFETGDTSSLDVDQAQTLLYNTIAGVSDLEISLQQLKNTLAVLLGRPPQDLSALLGETKPIPAVSPEVAVGMPKDLIRRRPDIRSAERRLASQSAQVGFAITELLSLIHISEPTRQPATSRMPSSA